MFSSLKGKQVKIKQKDGFFKYGTLIEEDEDFVQIKFDDGRLHFVAKDKIDTMEGA